MVVEIQQIELGLLDDHRDNPRLVWREDIIDGIAAQLDDAGGYFDPAHALLVRPVDGRYEIVRGHHRKRAALKVLLDTVPCWVRDMPDDEAYMQLVLGNVQGEVSPLEIGVHALGAVEDGRGGRGVMGGIGEYARRLGKSQQYISQLRQAARVYAMIETHKLTCEFLGKSQHLYAISKAPELLWSILVELMLENDWPVMMVESHVVTAKHIHDKISATWQELFLDPESLLRASVSRRAIGKLVSMADAIVAMIESYQVDHDQFLRGFYDWLAQVRPLDIRSLSEYQRGLQKRLADAEREPAYLWQGDGIAWLDEQEDCDLLLTDPPYMTDVEDVIAFAVDWLPRALAKVKGTGRAYVFIGAYPEELGAYLNIPVPGHLTLSNVLVWEYRNTLGPSPSHDYKLNWQAILYYQGKDALPLNCPVMTEQFAVQDVNAPDGRLGNRYHTWQKPDELAERLIMHSTKAEAIILDPFAGTGTFILAASRLGRVGLGCEIDESMLEIAMERGCVAGG